jgi:hypothetical protein
MPLGHHASGVSLLTLALLLYLGLDFGNPLIQGAVSFDPDESVEGVQRSGAHAFQHLVSAPAPQPAHVEPPVAAATVTLAPRADTALLVRPVRLSHRVHRRPPPASRSSDDH